MAVNEHTLKKIKAIEYQLYWINSNLPNCNKNVQFYWWIIKEVEQVQFDIIIQEQQHNGDKYIENMENFTNEAKNFPKLKSDIIITKRSVDVNLKDLWQSRDKNWQISSR